MKRSKIIRPEIEVEFVGVKGFIVFLIGICKVGLIKRAYINCHLLTFTPKTHGFEGGTVKKLPYYIIPKYKLKKVKKIDESEGARE